MAPTLSSSSQLVKQGPEVGTDKTKKKKKKEERKISRPEAKARLLEDLGLGEGVGGIEDAYFNGIFDRLDLRATGFLSEGDYARMRGFVESSSVKKKLGTLKQDQARAKAKAHELEQQRTTEANRYGSSTVEQLEAAMASGDEEKIRAALAALAAADSAAVSSGIPQLEPEPEPEQQSEDLLDSFFGAGEGEAVSSLTVSGGSGGSEDDPWVMLSPTSSTQRAAAGGAAVDADTQQATDILADFFGSWEMIDHHDERADAADRGASPPSEPEPPPTSSSAPPVAIPAPAGAAGETSQPGSLIDDFFGTPPATTDAVAAPAPSGDALEVFFS